MVLKPARQVALVILEFPADPVEPTLTEIKVLARLTMTELFDGRCILCRQVALTRPLTPKCENTGLQLAHPCSPLVRPGTIVLTKFVVLTQVPLPLT